MSLPIRTVSEKLVYQDPANPWVKLYYDDVVFPTGVAGRYNRIVEGAGNVGVAVLPYSSSGMGLVSQFRYAIQKAVCEIPRGLGETGDPVGDAERELREETGLRPLKMVSLGAVYPNSAVLVTRVELFFAQCGSEPLQAPKNDPREICEFRWVPLEEVLTSIARGDIEDVFTLASVFRARLRGLI
jgi:8-oxo-dGTP pyrophosphatase MutT (NUDIX family)